MRSVRTGATKHSRISNRVPRPGADHPDRFGRRCASSGSKWEPILGYSRAVRPAITIIQVPRLIDTDAIVP